jgi:addiction module RelE/StbE family toxin
MNVIWTPKSLRAFKRLTRKNPSLRPLIEQTLRQLTQDPFQPSLHTHKLKSELSNVWSCSIDYSYRILFEFIEKSDSGEDSLLLINLGTHDEVY